MAHVYKRGKTWAVRFSKREKVWNPKTKKYESKLKQKQKGSFHTKAEATAYGIKMEAESLDGVDITENPIFAVYFEKWYETYKVPASRSNTIKRYKTIHKIIKAYFKEIKIKDITKQIYQQFINSYAKKHAETTVKKINIIIRACVNDAIDDGLINKDFTRRTTIHGNDKYSKHPEYLNLSEIKKIVQLCLANRITRYTSKYMVLLAIYSGARIGEISALTWQDIDFKNNIININKSYDSSFKEVGPPKTKSSIRKIPVDSFILNVIKELKANQQNYVFATTRTKLPPSNSAVNQFLAKLLKDNNMHKRDFTFHSLRHSHVAFLLSQGIDITVISKRLGHANIAITLKHYAYLLEEFKHSQDEKIIESLDNLSA